MPVLHLPQHQIDGPTPADVLPRFPAVEQEIGVRAAGFFERIREDRQTVEGAFPIDGGSEGHGGRREPGGIGDDGAEGVAEDVADE